MNSRRVSAQLVAELRAAGTPARAVAERAYLKSELEHAGASVPAMRAIVKAFVRAHRDLARDDLLALVAELWRAELHEARTAVVLLLHAYGGLLRKDDLKMVEGLLRESKTWALVDPLSIDVAGALVERFPALGATLNRWARDSDFWIRRASMLALLRPMSRGAGEWERFARYADAMLDEREFFIRKAIGWILREVSKKRPELVAAWCEARAHRMSGVTMREAVKYLPPRAAARIERTRKTKPG